MQQFVDFPTQQRGVVIFVFAAIQDQTGRVKLRDQAALHVAYQRQEVFTQWVNQIFRQRKAQHLLYAANQQRHALFNLVAIARRMRHAVTAVETVFKNRAEFIFQDRQRLRRGDVTVAQINILARQEAVKEVALFNFRPGRQRRLQCGQRARVYI